ncbi:Nucleic acid-binding [Vigna unguiculata]|uniref:Nucleic acid-binding n=1 Tax=Vigna unguiculata TaxID=3917 RepID=A0A4D6LD02_VIGUN|nr:Nucleic acid-binding [Vigna unguiculata]
MNNVPMFVFRYKLRLCVIDAIDSTTFVVFDRDASAMWKKSCSDILDLQDKNIVVGNLPKEFEVLIGKTYLFKVECENDYNSKFDQSFRVKKVCMDEKVIESFSDVEVKSKEFEVLIDKTYMFKVECENDYNSKFDQSFRVKKVCMDEKVIESFSDVEVKSSDVYSGNEEESKFKQITNEMSSDNIAEDLLIKFTEEPKDVETLSDHLNTIGSRHVSTEEALINKAIIDVEIDELTHKESSHLENHSFDLATKTRVPVIKTQNRSLVQENKKIPVKMLKKNIKIKK